MNPRCAAPQPPGNWVDAEECTCGATYEYYRTGDSFEQAANRLRRANYPFPDSRGPVLWAMRVYKLGMWYTEHSYCDPEYCDAQGPPAPSTDGDSWHGR